MKSSSNENMVYLGITSKGTWKTIMNGGILNDFPGTTFTIIKQSMFDELSMGEVHVKESLSE